MTKEISGLLRQLIKYKSKNHEAKVKLNDVEICENLFDNNNQKNNDKFVTMNEVQSLPTPISLQT